MVQHKAYKFRLYPTKTQEQQLAQWFGSVRFVWNHMLAANIARYEREQKFIFRFDQQKILTELKQDDELSWLKQVPIHALQAPLIALDKALKASFKSRTNRFGFPKFKKKHVSEQSIQLPKQNWKLEGNRIRLPKQLTIKFKQHREIEGKMKSCTIKRTASGKFWLIILAELPAVEPTAQQNSIGIDLGLTSFISTSDGEQVALPKFFHESESEIGYLTRQLQKKQRGSNNYHKARKKLAIAHERVANKRAEFHNQLIASITKKHDLVCVEDLNIKGMIKNQRLAKAIANAGWRSFLDKLEAKLHSVGGDMIKVDRFAPTTRTCSACGQYHEMALSDRIMVCDCGNYMDRDINAAVNIHTLGTRDRACGGAECGELVATDSSYGPMKQEATEPLGSW